MMRWVLVVVVIGALVLPSYGEEDKVSGNEGLETFREDTLRHLDEEKNKILAELENILDSQVFKTNVFFGTIGSLFVIGAGLFITVFTLNVFTDWFSVPIRKVRSLLGLKSSRGVSGHHSPLSTAIREPLEKRSRSRGSARSGSGSKKPSRK